MEFARFESGQKSENRLEQTGDVFSVFDHPVFDNQEICRSVEFVKRVYVLSLETFASWSDIVSQATGNESQSCLVDIVEYLSQQSHLSDMQKKKVFAYFIDLTISSLQVVDYTVFQNMLIGTAYGIKQLIDQGKRVYFASASTGSLTSSEYYVHREINKIITEGFGLSAVSEFNAHTDVSDAQNIALVIADDCSLSGYNILFYLKNFLPKTIDDNQVYMYLAVSSTEAITYILALYPSIQIKDMGKQIVSVEEMLEQCKDILLDEDESHALQGLLALKANTSIFERTKKRLHNVLISYGQGTYGETAKIGDNGIPFIRDMVRYVLKPEYKYGAECFEGEPVMIKQSALGSLYQLLDINDKHYLALIDNPNSKQAIEVGEPHLAKLEAMLTILREVLENDDEYELVIQNRKEGDHTQQVLIDITKSGD